eukprot:scaffold141914_cov37-Cyclotella_meneghiniana.AAC.1
MRLYSLVRLASTMSRWNRSTSTRRVKILAAAPMRHFVSRLFQQRGAFGYPSLCLHHGAGGLRSQCWRTLQEARN